MKLPEMMYGALPWKSIGVSLSSINAIKADILAITDDPGTVKKAVLVFDELLANIVSYSGAKKAGYFCEREDSGLLLGIFDDGAEFDPTAYAAEEKDPFNLDCGGMGLSVVAQTVKEWAYRRENGINTVLMRLQLSENQHGA